MIKKLLFLLVLLLTATTGAWAQTTHVVTQTTVDNIFNGDGYTLGDAVKAGDVLDFQGEIDLGEETSHSLIINKQVTIISSTKNAVVKLHTQSGSLLGDNPGNCFVINKAASGSTLQDIQLFNTEAWFYNTSNVTFTGVTFHVEDARVGAGVGGVSIRYSDHLTFDGCTFYTKNNGGSTAFTVNASNNCTFQNCSFETEGNVGNTLYLGNVYNLNDKPENFGDNVQSTDCTVLNCSFTRSGTSSPAMMLLGGLRHRIEGVTSKNLSISSAFGAAAPASADDGHIYRNNTYKGNMTVLPYSTAENNTLSGGTFTVQQGATATGNTITSNVTVSGIGATVKDNTITGNVSLSKNDIIVTGNKVQGKLTHSQKTATITGNTIISTEEYAVYLNSTAADANNTVTNNELKAATKTGDEAVSSKSTSNTIKDNGDVTYTATMKEGVQDADKWTISPTKAAEGTTITATYNGTKKVLGVKAEKKAAGLTYPIALSAVTEEYTGSVVTTDGNVYATVAAATAASKTAVAMIAYVGSSTGDATYNHGLAIALSNEGNMNWLTAMSACEGKAAVTGAKWYLPSRDNWAKMIAANGGNQDNYSELNTKLETASGEGSKLPNGDYWTSTNGGDISEAYIVSLSNGSANFNGIDYKEEFRAVRACLAF